MNTASNEYRVIGRDARGTHTFSADLELTQEEQVSLSLALKEALAAQGIRMCHEEIVSQTKDFHPASHTGKLVELYRRVDAMLHGRHTWNGRKAVR